MAAFPLQWQQGVVATEVVWPEKQNVLLTGPLWEKFADPLLNPDAFIFINAGLWYGL